MHSFLLKSGIGCYASVAMASLATSAEADELRLFRDKEDNQIEARILSISGDRRDLRIERSDGRMFEIEIVKLSLDSQQEVKNWLTSQPGAAESLSLEMNAQRSDGESVREKLEGPQRATWDEDRFGYRISVKSRTAQNVSDLRLEYCLLLRERVSVRPRTAVTEDDPMRWRVRAGGEIRYLRGTVKLPMLRFNNQEFIDTATMTFDSVRIFGKARDLAEDEPIGLLARVIDTQGRTVAEIGDLHRDFASLKWEQIETRFDPQEAEGTGMLVEQMVSR